PAPGRQRHRRPAATDARRRSQRRVPALPRKLQPPDPGVLRDQRRNRFGQRQMNVAPALSHLLAGVGTPKSPPRTRSGGRERVRRAHDVADFRADAPHQIKPGSIKPFPHPSRHHQRGAMAITIAIMLLGLIFMLGLVEIGYLYWAKRDTQKVADL